MVFTTKYKGHIRKYEIMSISQRIGKSTKEKLNELQAKIFLIKKRKYTITEILDKIITFSIKNEHDLLEFLSEEEKKKESNLQEEKFFEFLLTPIEGAGPEDYEEYENNED